MDGSDKIEVTVIVLAKNSSRFKFEIDNSVHSCFNQPTCSREFVENLKSENESSDDIRFTLHG